MAPVEKRFKHPMIYLVLGLALALATYWGISLRRQAQQFDIVHPTRGPIVEAIYGLGTVKASRVYVVKNGVATTIQEVKTAEGDRVRGGQPLLRTDEAWVKAPWDGIVTTVAANAGENVMPGQPVLTISDPTHTYMIVSLEQQDALRIRAGQTARISFETLRSQQIQETVKTVYSKDEQQFNVKIDLTQLPDGILPGMTADVSIEVGRRENALLVPQAAIHEGRIFVRKGLKTEKLPCKVGVTDGRFAELLAPVLDESAEVQVPKTRTAGVGADLGI